MKNSLLPDLDQQRSDSLLDFVFVLTFFPAGDSDTFVIVPGAGARLEALEKLMTGPLDPLDSP